MMIGGDKETVDHLDPIFAALAPGIGEIARTPGREGRDPRAEQGYIHAGPTGAGHFVKMVHNGIEYGLMQAYAEGFDILRNTSVRGAAGGPSASASNMADIAEVWRRGSVISSWLLDLDRDRAGAGPEAREFLGLREDSGEGRWTVEAAIEEAVPAEVLSAALYARFRSRQQHTFAEKLLSAMRNGFGGHVEQGHEPARPSPKPRSKQCPTPVIAASREGDRGAAARDAKPPGPCTMVIFGAGGDLTKRLLVPALYNLARTKLLPEHFAIIGVDLADRTVEDWRDIAASRCCRASSAIRRAKSISSRSIDEDAGTSSPAACPISRGDLTKPDLYQQLGER